MAGISNYKDPLLGGYEGSRVTEGDGFGVSEWVPLGDAQGLKPENNATVGATFDININGLADTHNIALNAVTESQSNSTTNYNAGTEIMEVSVDLVTQEGEVVLFITGFYESNADSTASSTNESKVTLTISADGIELLSSDVVRIPNQVGTPYRGSFTDNYTDSPVPTDDNGFLVDDIGSFFVTNNGTFLVYNASSGQSFNYTVGFEYSSTCDGTRGKIISLSVYGMVLKR